MNAHPLSIAQWRDALWGDYHVDSEPPLPNVKGRNQECQNTWQAICALFGSTGGLPVYCEADEVTWGEQKLHLKDVDEPALHMQLLWEAHQVNWCCKFLELDAELTCTCQSLTYACWEREAQVCRV